MNMRVYELASILGLTNKQTLEILWQNNVDVKNHMSIVSNEMVDKIKNDIFFEKDYSSHKNESSLKYIEIWGLFNKYDYKINFETDINIFVAENGFGKTTILNIIVSVLKGDKTRLSKLPFVKVVLGINNERIEINKTELTAFSISKMEMRELIVHNRKFMTEYEYRQIMDKYFMDDIDTDELIYLIKKYTNDPVLYNEFRHMVLQNENNKESKKLDKKFFSIRKLLKEDLLYFPTYRRIEEELGSFVKVNSGEARLFKEKLDNSTINFGMEDVESVINELTNKLKNDAFNNYSIMNGEIIDDLLSNKVELSHNEKRKIDIEKVNIVVGRIGQSRIKELDKLLNFIKNDTKVANKNFLEYYLFKLINIYENQKAIDEKIKKYKDVCNRYLVNKEIIYDEVVPEVKLVDKEDGRKLNFSCLSSGEKQIVSLFSKLYLNTSKPVLFIIDEPELSLSIIWQEKLLQDIFDSERISLLITATHSPFIFHNKYKIFAKDLRMFRGGDKNE